jgi:hypothetical protein
MEIGNLIIVLNVHQYIIASPCGSQGNMGWVDFTLVNTLLPYLCACP